jgi:hypothetical protein
MVDWNATLLEGSNKPLYNRLSVVIKVSRSGYPLNVQFLLRRHHPKLNQRISRKVSEPTLRSHSYVGAVAVGQWSLHRYISGFHSEHVLSDV